MIHFVLSVSLEYNALLYPFQSCEDPIPLDYDNFLPSFPNLTDRSYIKKNNIGQIISGIFAQQSPFSFHFNGSLTEICTEIVEQEYSLSQKEKLVNLISKNYFGTLSLNNVPLKSQTNFGRNYQIGFEYHSKHYIYNHYNFKIYFQKNALNSSIYDVSDFILESQVSNEISHCKAPHSRQISIEMNSYIPFSYSYSFIILDPSASSEKGSNSLLNIQNLTIPFTKNDLFFKRILSIFPGSILLLVVIFFFTRTKSSTKSVSDLSLDEIDPLEEAGWKLVHGDVFRRPSHVIYLSGIYGTGIQFLFAILFSFVFALQGQYSFPEF